MTRGFTSSIRLWVVCTMVLLGFGCIGARLVHLQVIEADRLISQVERARKGIQVIRGRRGEIRDSNGTVLATSRVMFDVGLDPHVTRPEDAGKLPRLAAVLNQPVADIVAAFHRRIERGGDGQTSRPVRWTRLAEAVDDETYQRVLALDIKGVYGNRQYRRTYPGGALAAHVIGFVNHDNVAAMGIEQHLDYYLRGQNGWREFERDGHKRELAQFRTREVLPTDGLSVVLTIDSYVQHCIETELREIQRRLDPVGATIIVSDPRDGSILGLANYPTFDLNFFHRSDLDSQRNRAITDTYEPGSTFKIVAASGALDRTLVTPETPFDCGPATVFYQGRTLRLPGDTHAYGVLSMREVVTKSSNRGAAHLGMLLGPDRLYEYAAAFGFGERSGFALAGEVAGLLHPVDKWDGLTISRLPMGHAVSATPLQVHFAMATIANGGVLMRPQVVKRIVDRDSATVFEFAPVSRRRAVRAETAQEMARLLVGAASPEGTAPKAAIPGFEVAGKTGTTQKLIDNRYSRTHHVGSFVGFFPASRPRVVISVIIDDPRTSGVGFGSTVAAPSFKTIAEQLIQYLGISPTVPVPATVNVAQSRRPATSSHGRLR